MEKLTAVWLPMWYALDQKVARGLADKFIFHNHEDERQFFSGAGRGEGMEAIYAKITRIHNSTLGEVEEIDTLGLSYRIWLPGNDMVQLNAEEQPAMLEGTTLERFKPLLMKEFEDTTFTVELEKLYPSDIAGLEMLPVMINDEVHDYFKWADHDYDDITDASAYMGGMVHYLLQMMNNTEANEMKIRQAMMFIDRIYTDTNPLLSSIIDESILHPFSLREDTHGFTEKYFCEATLARISNYRQRMEIINKTRNINR